jgi:hypothetical protein
MAAGRWDAQRADRDRRQAETHLRAADDVGELSDRDLLIAGAAIYWCEGSKSKPWRRLDRLTFVNSDPALLSLFLRFLEACGRSADSLRYRVQIHETADAEAAGGLAAAWGMGDGIVLTISRRASSRLASCRAGGLWFA